MGGTRYIGGAPRRGGGRPPSGVVVIVSMSMLLSVVATMVITPMALGDLDDSLSTPVAKFRMSLGNIGNAPGWIPKDNLTLWVKRTDSPVLSSPVVYDGRVYVGTMGGSVLCLSATSGSVLWEYMTGGPVESTPAVVDGRVHIGSDDRNMYCLDALTGELVWNATTGGEVKSSPTVWDGRVVFGSSDFDVHCLNATTGAPVWTFSTGGWVYSSPAVWSGRAYVGSCDGRLYCLNATTGSEIWRFEAQYMPASPAVVNGVVVVGAYDDRLYMLDALSGAEVWNVSAGEGGIYSSAAIVRSGVRETIAAYFGENGGRLSWAINGEVVGSWDLGGAVKSSPVYLFSLVGEYPDQTIGSAVIVGTEAGEVVAVNPLYTALDPSFGPEYWWRLALGTSVSSSPFMYNRRVYISAVDGDAGLVACIGDLLPSEGSISILRPTEGSHVVSPFNVLFNGTGDGGSQAKVLVGWATFPATWRTDHWEANIALESTVGPVRVIARVLSADDQVLAEGSVDIVVRDPSGSRPVVVIGEPRPGARIDSVMVASGRVEGDYPPLRIEWSWDDSGCWTAIDPEPNWTTAMTTTDLTDGRHTLRVRAFDGMFTGEAAVRVVVGEEKAEHEVASWDVIAVVLLLAVVFTLMLTRPRPPPKPSVPSPEPTGKG